MTQTLRVLMIEDSEDDALLLARELKRGGLDFAFERVDSANAVREAVVSRPWELILCDYSMPHLKGTDALRLVRETGLDIPFIFVSGTIQEDTAVEAMRSGAQDYLMKGNLKRLIPAIRRELGEVEVRRKRAQALPAPTACRGGVGVRRSAAFGGGGGGVGGGGGGGVVGGEWAAEELVGGGGVGGGVGGVVVASWWRRW